MKAKVKAKKAAEIPAKTRKGRTTSTRLSAKNQITLPVDIIRKAGFKVGDTINCRVNEKGMVELFTPENRIMSLLGAGNGIYDNYDFAAERADAWDE